VRDHLDYLTRKVETAPCRSLADTRLKLEFIRLSAFEDIGEPVPDGFQALMSILDSAA
jgi:hypothetical protein